MEPAIGVPLDGAYSGGANLRVIVASSVATVFEWFDFFLYGSLAVILGRKFFSNTNDASAFVLALLAFAAGFAVRPFGAIVFGFLGDLWGRKSHVYCHAAADGCSDVQRGASSHV